MGFLYKQLLHPIISRVTGQKAFKTSSVNNRQFFLASTETKRGIQIFMQ